MTTQTLTFISAIAILGTALFFSAFRLFKTFYLLKEAKTRLNLETEQKEHYKKKLAASPTRQEFIEQSEMATSWRQKHDRLAVQAELLHNDFVKMTKLLKEANDAAISCETVKGIDHQIKSTEGEEKLTHNGLMKQFVDDRLNELEQQTEIDWSKPQRFPKGYKIPVGLRVVAITNGGFSEKTCVAGDIGTVLNISQTGNAFVLFDGRESCNKNGSCMYNRELSPLDPTDHPLHPDFNPSKYEA